MENVMRVHLTVIAGLLAIAGRAGAEPAKTAVPAPAEPQHRSAPIMLASAEIGHAPTSPETGQPAPAKRRIARVTTCRCGDQQPDPEQPDR
jgi:hypothetical protein